ncbi:30S ribosomal protein S2 [soil metagenome]
MAVVTMRQLLESGVHFGHQTRRWNPKMKRFIFTERNGIYIIDLQQSLSYIDRSFEFVKATVARGGQILFVGTKKQAQAAIAEQSTRVGMPYVNQRWLGGMLTNFQTVNKRLQRLKELEEVDFDDVASSDRTKKELLGMRREMAKLERRLGGIRDMGRVPAAVWVIDTNKEHLAIDEAKKLGIPVVAVLDTNCDPDDVDYPIPGNDDAIRSVTLLTRVIADAVAEGLLARSGVRTGEEPSGTEVGADEPMAEWERELLGGAAGTAAEAAMSGTPAEVEPVPAATAVNGTADSPPASTADAPGDRPAASAQAEAVAGEALGATVADVTGDPTAGSETAALGAADEAEEAADPAAEVEAAVDSDAAVESATSEADKTSTV